jgi:hypothetical protein
MSTKSYTLIPHCLQDHNVQSWQRSFFPLHPERAAKFWRPKNHFWKQIWNVPLHILVSKWVRNMSSKSHTYKRCGTLRKKSFSAGGYAEIHIQRPFFDNKNSIWKVLGLKIGTVKTCSSASSTCSNFYFWKILKSRFLVEFQSFILGQILANLGSFGQFWADLGRFCCIDSGWQHAPTSAEILKTS